MADDKDRKRGRVTESLTILYAGETLGQCPNRLKNKNDRTSQLHLHELTAAIFIYAHAHVKIFHNFVLAANANMTCGPYQYSSDPALDPARRLLLPVR